MHRCLQAEICPEFFSSEFPLISVGDKARPVALHGGVHVADLRTVLLYRALVDKLGGYILLSLSNIKPSGWKTSHAT